MREAVIKRGESVYCRSIQLTILADMNNLVRDLFPHIATTAVLLVLV